MKIGVVFPQNEFGNDPAAIKDFLQFARRDMRWSLARSSPPG